MYIRKLDVKGFGKLSGQVLELSDGMNIVYGSNESGKTTLQWFIRAMLYGLKGGRASKDGLPSPFKRFKPWNGANFGGTMEYTLDNGSLFRVERDFDNNTVEVYDSSFNNISASFDTNRENGLLFAEKHLGSNEICFEKTVLIRQMETRLDDEGSRELLSRLANVSQTGLEDISFKRAEKVLKEALKSYVGTDRTTTQPVDRINARLEELKTARSKLVAGRNSLLDTEKKLNDEVNSRKELTKRKEFLLKIKEIIDCKKRFEEHKTMEEGLKASLLQLQTVETKLASASKEMEREHYTAEIPYARRRKTGKERSGLAYYAALFMIIVAVFCCAYGFMRNASGFVPAILLFAAATIILIRSKYKGMAAETAGDIKNNPGIKSLLPEIIELNGKLKDICSRASLVYGKYISGISDLKEAFSEVATNREALHERLGNGISEVMETYGTVSADFFEAARLVNIIYESSTSWLVDTWEYEMEHVNRSLDDAALMIKECETLLKPDYEDGDNLQSIDEETEELRLKKEDLGKTGTALRLALDVLCETSSEIRRSIAPVLNVKMSNAVSSLTGTRYNDLRADDGLALKTVSPDTGDVKPVLVLSGGTVDLMYLALRLAMADLLAASGEKLPLIMDEVFSQYDDMRTRKAFEYIHGEYGDRQVILFTCKSREVEIAREVGNDALVVPHVICLD